MLGKMKLSMTDGKQMLISPGAIRFVVLLPKGEKRDRNETMVWLTMPGQPFVVNAVVTDKFAAVVKLMGDVEKLQLRGTQGETIAIPAACIEAAVENSSDVTVLYTNLRGPQDSIRLEVLDSVESITDLLAPDEEVNDNEEQQEDAPVVEATPRRRRKAQGD